MAEIGVERRGLKAGCHGLGRDVLLGIPFIKPPLDLCLSYSWGSGGAFDYVTPQMRRAGKREPRFVNGGAKTDLQSILRLRRCTSSCPHNGLK